MFDKAKAVVEGLRLKAGVAWREHKERAEEKRAERQAAQAMEHHHGRFFLLTVPAAATILAAITEWYWAILFCIEATGAIDWNYETAIGSAAAPSSLWNFAFSTHWPVFLGLVCATVPIVMLSMVWLPLQFAMRGAGRFRRGSVIAVGLLANILVIVSGTVVMNYNRQDQVREAVVIEQTAAQGRAAIDARLAFEQEQLRLALTNTNPYLNQAASVGAAEWERSYVAQARATNDPRLPQLERALGAARAADERRANIERLTIERATAAPEAASAANVTDTVGAELNTFAQYVEVWRPPFIALICTLIGIFGTWWVIAMLEKMNPRDVLRSGWADEGHRIEDLRAEAPVEVRTDANGKVVMDRPREKMYDAETGEELIPRRGGWVRKPKRKGKAEAVDLSDPPPPDERGVEVDGGSRIATSLPGVPDVSDSGAAVSLNAGANEVAQGAHEADQHKADEQVVAGDAQIHEPSEPPPMSDENYSALVDELAGSVTPAPENSGPDVQDDSTAQADETSDGGEVADNGAVDASADAHDQHDDENQSDDADESVSHDRPPETRESHLLTANVAAE